MATTKSTPGNTTTAPAAEATANDDVKITVRSTPLLAKTAGAEPARADLTVHRKLTITPLTMVASQPVEVAEATLEPEAPELIIPPAATEPVAPKPPTDDAPKTDPKPAGEATPDRTEEMQSPKVFDTKKYHLPIDEGVGGGKGKYLVIFTVVLLLLVAGLIAIDAGWIDLGFN